MQGQPARGTLLARGVLAAGLVAAGLLAACTTALQRGERLYRQGDVVGALEVWRAVPEDSGEYAGVQARLQAVESEFGRLRRRYAQRAAFFEAEGRLAEAVLYYRLARQIDPGREELLDRVQVLVRELLARTESERAALDAALEAGELPRAIHHADRLDALDPFDPSLQLEIRHVRAATGARVLHHMSTGEAAYAIGNRAAAKASFEEVLALDPHNERALGYLSYIGRFDQTRQHIPRPPQSISQEEIVAEGHYRSARQAEAAGEDFWAITQYEAALAVNPEHEGARTALRALRERRAPDVGRLYQLGKRYFQDEDLHNALRTWREALAIDPADERTRENVERAERMLARLEELQTDASGS